MVRELPGGGIGPIPLTPIVYDMLEHGESWQRYAQAVLIGLPAASAEHSSYPPCRRSWIGMTCCEAR